MLTSKKTGCPFCTKRDAKKRVILENEYAWAFPTHTPIVPGHVLICPKRCIPKLDDLRDDEITAILELRSRLKFALRIAFGANGFNYAWNEEPIAGQTVPHFHLHMVPRKLGDAGILNYEPRAFLYRPGSREISPHAELRAITQTIKQALSNLPTATPDNSRENRFN